MRPAEETHRYLQRQLAGADRKARTHARDLRDRTGRRCREADAAAVARPATQRRHSLRRPPGVARYSVQPEERAGNRECAGDPDGAAAANDGRADGAGDQDAVATLRRRPCESRDPYSAAVVVGNGWEYLRVTPARGF